jgi:hypothetical protein
LAALKRVDVDRWLVFVVCAAACVCLATVPGVLHRLDPLTGDEPFYVMTAISIARDHDLDESNNYANQDYDEFYPADPLPRGWQGWPSFPRVLPPHPAHSSLPGLHTKHGLGLSLLIALPFAAGGRLGALLVVVACAMALAGQMYLLARETRAPPALAAAVALALAVSMPILPYATLLFPEVPAALLLLYAVRRLSADSNATAQFVAAGAAIGFLPWLHQRFGPTALMLALVFLVRWVGRAPWRQLAAGLAPVAVGGLAIVLYNEWLYGQFTQSTADHAGFSNASGTLNGGFGLLLDAQWGLWIVAPLLLLALAALPWWLETSPRAALTALAAVAPYLLVVAAYNVWWGEWGPPARYLVPVVPLAAGPLASWLTRASNLGRAVAGLVWGFGAALTLIGLRNPQRFYHQPDGYNHLTGRLGDALHIQLAQHLVAYQPYALSPRADRIFAGLIALAALLLAMLFIWVIPVVQRATRFAAEGPPER